MRQLRIRELAPVLIWTSPRPLLHELYLLGGHMYGTDRIWQNGVHEATGELSAAVLLPAFSVIISEMGFRDSVRAVNKTQRLNAKRQYTWNTCLFFFNEDTCS